MNRVVVVAETQRVDMYMFFGRGGKPTYAGDYGVMACEVSLAGFAAEDLVGV